MSEQHVNLDNSRHDDQRRVMETIVGDNVCPFCLDNLKKYHQRPILSEGDHWLVTTNQWPYEHTQAHFLLIAKRHIESVTELEPGAFEELGGHIQKLVQDNGLDYGGVAMRFGDVRYTGASVNHLHAHVLQAVKDLPEGAKLRMKFSR
jgi:diadenosine tetraphosphate (Ap4A) HIT family hydrolase